MAVMTPAQLLDQLFSPVDVDTSGDLRSFLKITGLGAPATASDFERLAAVALRASSRLGASAAGHQSSIRRMFPGTPADAITAFCVSEDQGPQPSKILSKLTPTATGYVLDGRKRWGSMSPLADILYVAASIGVKDGRNQLRMVQVATDRPGLTFDTSAYADYRDHMPIADMMFSDCAVAPGEVIEVDAYETFIKPFRLVEDVYTTVGVQIGLLRLGRTHGWAQDVLEDLVGLIVQAHAISETPMARPADVLLMSAYFRASGALWDRLGDNWRLVPDEERAAWSPDVGTLGIAARAREARRVNAWTALAGV